MAIIVHMATDTTPLTAREVSRLLHVSIRTVHRMVARGDLPTIGKLPGVRGSYLFDRETLSSTDRRKAAS